MCKLQRYNELLAEANASGRPVPDYLRQELPYEWQEAYLEMAPRSTSIVVFTHGTFDYIYDDYATLEATGVVATDRVSEARLVAAIGVSAPNPKRRSHDDGRLRGWVGPTGATFGDAVDKGHYIGHSIGGAVDGLEANVFLQNRRVNRGAYRKMERYCAATPGVLCFSRPLYRDQSSRPAQVEFGVLRPSGEWWVEVFENG